jgi:hypothetical protein
LLKVVHLSSSKVEVLILLLLFFLFFFRILFRDPLTLLLRSLLLYYLGGPGEQWLLQHVLCNEELSVLGLAAAGLDPA